MNALGKYCKKVLLRYLNRPWLPQGGASALLLGRDLPWAAGHLLQSHNHHRFLWVLESRPLELSFHMRQAGDQVNPEEKLLLYLGSNLQTNQSCFCLSIKEMKVKPLCATASRRDESPGCDEKKTTKGTRSQSSLIWMGQKDNLDKDIFNRILWALLSQSVSIRGLVARDTGVSKPSSGLSEWTLAAIMKSPLASAERFVGL